MQCVSADRLATREPNARTVAATGAEATGKCRLSRRSSPACCGRDGPRRRCAEPAGRRCRSASAERVNSNTNFAKLRRSRYPAGCRMANPRLLALDARRDPGCGAAGWMRIVGGARSTSARCAERSRTQTSATPAARLPIPTPPVGRTAEPDPDRRCRPDRDRPRMDRAQSAVDGMRARRGDRLARRADRRRRSARARWLIYAAITGHVPLRGARPGRGGRRRRRGDAAARSSSASDEIERADRARGRARRRAREPDRGGAAPPGGAARADRDAAKRRRTREARADDGPRGARRSAHRARGPEERELPLAIFEKEKVTIPAGAWGQRARARGREAQPRRRPDGKPEQIRYFDDEDRRAAAHGAGPGLRRRDRHLAASYARRQARAADARHERRRQARRLGAVRRTAA